MNKTEMKKLMKAPFSEIIKAIKDKDIDKELKALESCSEADKEAFIKQTATELFEEIQQCGYEEGYDTAYCVELND